MDNPTTITLTSEAANAIPAEALREFLEAHGCRAREWESGEIRVDVPAESGRGSTGGE